MSTSLLPYPISLFHTLYGYSCMYTYIQITHMNTYIDTNIARGGRLLRKWLKQPLFSAYEIDQRCIAIQPLTPSLSHSLYMCIHVYIAQYTYAYIHTYTQRRWRTAPPMSVCVSLSDHVSTNLSLYTYSYIRTHHIHICIQTYIQIPTAGGGRLLRN